MAEIPQPKGMETSVVITASVAAKAPIRSGGWGTTFARMPNLLVAKLGADCFFTTSKEKKVDGKKTSEGGDKAPEKGQEDKEINSLVVFRSSKYDLAVAKEKIRTKKAQQAETYRDFEPEKEQVPVFSQVPERSPEELQRLEERFKPSSGRSVIKQSQKEYKTNMKQFRELKNKRRSYRKARKAAARKELEKEKKEEE